MAKAVFCIADTREKAELIVDRLRALGFSGEDISVLMPDRSGTHDFAHKKATKAPEGTVAGAGTGGVIGGALGYLAGIGALTIPGIGPLIAAGPIMAALSGAAVGGAVGGVTGALVGMGMPEYEAKRYAGKVEDGNILVSAHTEDSDEASAARVVFKKAGATDISSAGEVGNAEEGKRREEGERPIEGHPEERHRVDERTAEERRAEGTPPPGTPPRRARDERGLDERR